MLRMTDVTKILNAIVQGDPSASDKLLPLVYEELRVLARQRLANEKPGQTLQPTALVHEAYMRLVGSDQDRNWNGRSHFFGAASEAIRRILVEQARNKKRSKRGGDNRRLDLDQVQNAVDSPSEELLALDHALSDLSEKSPEIAQVVKLRYFGGCTHEEAAAILGISSATARRRWAAARAWLYAEISDEESANEKS